VSNLIHQPADKLFKLSLEDRQVAQAFLRTHLPEALLRSLDLNTLIVEKQSFIDEAYKANAADVVYQIQLEGQPAYIYILCEQQTRVDPKMAFRLWVYTIRLMEAHLRQHPDEPLPLVYPLVVYSGERPWDAAFEIFPLFGEQEALARQWLLKPYQLFDIQRSSDDLLQRHTLCGLMEFALKYQKVRNFAALLETLFPWMTQLEVQHPQSGVFIGKVVLQYLLDGIEAEDIELFTQKANYHLTHTLRGEAMTLAQRFEERGVERGIQQGLQQGIQQGMQQGIQQGMQQGMQQGEIALLTQQLQYRFGKLPAVYADRIAQADTQMLLQWGKKVLEAETLEDVFNEG
jgi:predicted transposase/invertase (TIGR01784 family)